MYCNLEYIELPNFHDDSVPSLTQILTYQANEGLEQENKKMLFNPNCPIQLLLEYLCTEIGLDRSLDFDLCDMSTGETVNIKEMHLWSYATNILKAQQSYVFIVFEKDSLGTYKVLEPLLNKQSKQYADVLLRLKRQKGLIKKMSPVVKRSRRMGSSSKMSVSSCDYVSSKR